MLEGILRPRVVVDSFGIRFLHRKESTNARMGIEKCLLYPRCPPEEINECSRGYLAITSQPSKIKASMIVK